MSSLRDRLAKKRAHSTSLTFPIGEEGQAAKAELDDAENNERLVDMVAKGENGKAARQRATTRVTKAKRAYEKHSVTIHFRGLTDDEWDALISAHPPTDEQQQKERDDNVPEEQRSLVDLATFLPAALAVCALDSDLSEEDWTVELASGRWTRGEKLALSNAVQQATNAQPAPGVGKGFATIR